MRLLLFCVLGLALAAAEPRRAKGRNGGSTARKRPNFKIVEEDPRAPQVTVSKEDASNREGKGDILLFFFFPLFAHQVECFCFFSVFSLFHIVQFKNDGCAGQR